MEHIVAILPVDLVALGNILFSCKTWKLFLPTFFFLSVSFYFFVDISHMFYVLFFSPSLF